MKVITQGCYINTVRRHGEGSFVSDSTLMSTEFEGTAALVCDINSFEIKDAKWAIHRAPDEERRGEGTAEILIGESGYIEDKRNSIKILPDYSYSTDYLLPPGEWDQSKNPAARRKEHKESLRKEPAEEISPEWKIIRELFNENLRGIYQAEAVLLEERGYKCLMDYEEFWESQKADYCRPYTGNMPALDEWPIYTGHHQNYRRDVMYNKYKQYTVMDAGNGSFTALTAYNDSFHEMDIELMFQKDGTITAFDMETKRVPFAPCRGLDHLNPEEVIGKNLYEMAKRDAGKLLGGPMGCYHFVDIMWDVIDALKRNRQSL